MLDTRAVYNSLLNDSSLDSLLADAQSKVAAQGITANCETVEDLDKIAAAVQANAAQVRADLMSEQNAKLALRTEKVAIAVHCLRVLNKLVA